MFQINNTAILEFLKSCQHSALKFVLGVSLIILGGLFVIFPEHLSSFLAGFLMFIGVFFLYSSKCALRPK